MSAIIASVFKLNEESSVIFCAILSVCIDIIIDERKSNVRMNDEKYAMAMYL